MTPRSAARIASLPSPPRPPRVRWPWSSRARASTAPSRPSLWAIPRAARPRRSKGDDAGAGPGRAGLVGGRGSSVVGNTIGVTAAGAPSANAIGALIGGDTADFLVQGNTIAENHGGGLFIGMPVLHSGMSLARRRQADLKPDLRELRPGPEPAGRRRPRGGPAGARAEGAARELRGRHRERRRRWGRRQQRSAEQSR